MLFKILFSVLLVFTVSSSMIFAQKASLDGKIFRIKAVSAKANGKCLEVTVDSIGTKIQFGHCYKEDNLYQDWIFKKVKNNTYLIKNQAYPIGAALEADIYTYNKNGGNIQLETTHGKKNQLWIVKQNANGTFRISSADPKAGGRLLEAGEEIQLWSPNGKPSQSWALIESKHGKPVLPIKNISEGKKATQSTTAFNSPASNAVNGNTGGRYTRNRSTNDITHTNDANGSWWQVDLGEIYDIDRIKIWNRTDCCWERLQNFYLIAWAFPINENLTSGSGITGPHSFTSKNQNTITLEGTFVGRYIRIWMDNDDKPLSLAEVQVFGVPIKIKK